MSGFEAPAPPSRRPQAHPASSPSTPAAASAGAAATSAAERIIEPAEVARHASAADCWVVYRGLVIDVTRYLPQRKGATVARGAGTPPRCDLCVSRVCARVCMCGVQILVDGG